MQGAESLSDHSVSAVPYYIEIHLELIKTNWRMELTTKRMELQNEDKKAT